MYVVNYHCNNIYLYQDHFKSEIPLFLTMFVPINCFLFCVIHISLKCYDIVNYYGVVKCQNKFNLTLFYVPNLKIIVGTIVGCWITYNECNFYYLIIFILNSLLLILITIYPVVVYNNVHKPIIMCMLFISIINKVIYVFFKYKLCDYLI